MSGDEYITPAQAAKLFPQRNGKPPHYHTVLRRILRGVGGVKLKAIADGQRWFTTAAWVREFQDELTAVRSGQRPHAVAGTDAATEAAVAYLERRLGRGKGKAAAAPSV